MMLSQQKRNVGSIDRVLDLQTPEALEHRLLLAGDVSVVSAGDDLVIRGDDAGNQIEIVRIGSQTRVRGINTLINGSSAAIFLTFADDLRVDMGGGNDRLTLGSGSGDTLVVADDLSVKMGRGRDIVNVFNTVVGDDAKINMGGGDTNLLVYGLYVTDLTSMVAGSDGTATIELYTSVFDDDLKIRTGNSSDSIDLEYVEVADDLKIVTRGGNDEVNFAVDTVYGPVHGANVVAGDLRVALGSGNDQLTVVADIRGKLAVSEGAGIDVVSLDDESPF
jgi:hypothetical protein